MSFTIFEEDGCEVRGGTQAVDVVQGYMNYVVEATMGEAEVESLPLVRSTRLNTMQRQTGPCPLFVEELRVTFGAGL